VKSFNSSDARGIAGRKESSSTFTNNYAASDMTIYYYGSTPAADTGLDGIDTYARADFEGPLSSPSPYDSGKLDWNFTPGNPEPDVWWKFLPASANYPYPVLSWQTEPPTDPADFLGTFE
jgi:hypothetical protein